MKLLHFLKTGIRVIWFYLILSCSNDFLDTTPTAISSNKTLANENGINHVLIGAYSAIDGAGGGLQKSSLCSFRRGTLSLDCTTA